MLMFAKRWRRIGSGLRALRERASFWWTVMTDRERRILVQRGMTLSACALAVTVAMPTLSQVHVYKLAEAESASKATRFAETLNGREGVQAGEYVPAILDTPWFIRAEHAITRDSRAMLTRYAGRDRDNMAVESVVSFEPRHFDLAEGIARDHHCLSQAVYYESANESVSGQISVAEVVMNRVADHRYPNSVCEVVYQGATRTTGCQFTFTCDGALSRKPEETRWRRSQAVAAHALMDLHERRTGQATHYHATYVNPVWNSGLVRTGKIGTHIFYRFPRGAEWAEANATLAARMSREDARRAAQATRVSDEAPGSTSDALETAAP